MQHIFVYGSLQSPEIIEKLTGKCFKTTRSVLPGYRLYCVKDSDYPAIIKQEHSETNGLLIEDLDDSSLNIISFYEGDEYELQNVTVLVDKKFLNALAYVWIKEPELLEEKEWNYQRFNLESLEHYLNVVIPGTLKDLKWK